MQIEAQTRGLWRIHIEQRMLRAIDTLTAKLGRTPATATHLATGKRGEEAAFFHLRREGYVILARQWRTAKLRGDLDLIGWDGETLCFIEVKTRSTRTWGPAEFAVHEEKQRMLRLMARAYLKRCDDADTIPTRFDVISVYLDGDDAEFEILKDWFQLG